MYEKALVTGGAGFIGSHLTRALLAEGLQVTVLDDLSMGKQRNVPAEAQFIRGDVKSQDDVRRALEDVDVVFHEAARVSIRSSMTQFYEDAETNLLGTLNLLRCCEASPVRRIIYASSMAVYADCESPVPIPVDYVTEPISPYGISKLAGEKYCLGFSRSTGKDCQILRYFNTYGPGQTFTPYVGVITIFVNRLLQGLPPIIFGDGEQKRDFVHVSDIVAANVLAMKYSASQGVFNVGSGQPTSVNDVAHLLCDRINPDLRPQHAAAQPGELRYSVADISLTAGELGYCPQTTMDAAIEEVIQHCGQTESK